MLILTQLLQALEKLLPAPQSAAGADFLPFIGTLITRSLTALFFVVAAAVFRFFWRRIRYPRRMVCRLVSRGGIGHINGRPVAISLTDQQGAPYQVHQKPGVMLLELHNLRSEELLRAHIKGEEFTIAFGSAEVRAVYKEPETDPIRISHAGNAVTLSPQYLQPGEPIRLQIVLEGYDDDSVPEVKGEVVKGGPIKLVRLDRPDTAERFGRAFTFIFFLFIALLLFVMLLAVQMMYPRALIIQTVVAAVMALLLTGIPYSIYYEWLMERGEPGRDFPSQSLWKRITRYIPSIKFLRNEGFFWRMLIVAFFLSLSPLLGEMVISPLLARVAGGAGWILKAIQLAG